MILTKELRRLFFLLTLRIISLTGMPISEAFAQIEQRPNIYDVVHVKYLDEVCRIIILNILVGFHGSVL